MKGTRGVRSRVFVALGLAALVTAVAVVAIAPWASGATQFRHSATSPTFQFGTDQGVAYTVTNVGTTTVTCHVEFRRSDGSSFFKGLPSLGPGKAFVNTILGAPDSQTILRFVVTSTSPSRTNPCLPMIEILDVNGGSYSVAGVVSDFMVTNTSI